MNDLNSKNQRTQTLIDIFSEIEDPRINRTKDHKLIDILIIGVCSLICGGEGFNDMQIFGAAHFEWLKSYLELANGVPSHDTFNRVFSTINPKHFMNCFVQWTETLRTKLDCEIVAIDGKALRSAYNKDESIPYIVSAWTSNNGLTLGQVKVDQKSNEITAIPKLLQILDVTGCIVTIDAMGCQKSIAKEIINAKADYLFSLKGNQGTAEKEVKAFFEKKIPIDSELPVASYSCEGIESYQTNDNGHGRIETRRYWITDDIDWFDGKNKWTGLQSVAMVETKREINGESSYERRYFLSSIEADAKLFATGCRGHWGVENNLHWSLDVTFGEDYSRARNANAAENLAALRRLAIKNEKSDKKLSLRRKRLLAGWNHDYLKKVLGI